MIGLIAFRLTINLPRANQQTLSTDTGLDSGWAILADRPSTPAVIAVNFEEEVALQYLSTVWEVVPEIFPVAPDQFEGYQPNLNGAAVINRYASRAAVAAAPALVQHGHPQAAGAQLIALWPLPRTEAPPEIQAIAQPIGDQLTLIGWERVTHPWLWQIALYWQAPAPLPADYTVSVRPLVAGQLIQVDGEPLIQDHRPVWGLYPTSRWQPGEIVRDVYALSLPDDTVPNAVQIVVYKAMESGFENLGEVTIELTP